MGIDAFFMGYMDSLVKEGMVMIIPCLGMFDDSSRG
jgi:hypothetical protein